LPSPPEDDAARAAERLGPTFEGAGSRRRPRRSSARHQNAQSGETQCCARCAGVHDGDIPEEAEPLAAEFNPDDNDVIVASRPRDDAAFERTLATRARGALARARFPYSPRPGTVTAGDDRVQPPSRRNAAHASRALEQLEPTALETKLGTCDTVLVDRPAAARRRLHAVLVEAAVGELVEVRPSTGAEGIRAVAA